MCQKSYDKLVINRIWLLNISSTDSFRSLFLFPFRFSFSVYSYTCLHRQYTDRTNYDVEAMEMVPKLLGLSSSEDPSHKLRLSLGFRRHCSSIHHSRHSQKQASNLCKKFFNFLASLFCCSNSLSGYWFYYYLLKYMLVNRVFCGYFSLFLFYVDHWFIGSL